MLDHLKSHPGKVEDVETIHPVLTGQDHSKRSIFSGLSHIFSAIFGDGSSCGYSKAIIDKIK